MADHLPPEARNFFERDRRWCDTQARAVGPRCGELVAQLLGDRALFGERPFAGADRTLDRKSATDAFGSQAGADPPCLNDNNQRTADFQQRGSGAAQPQKAVPPYGRNSIPAAHLVAVEMRLTSGLVALEAGPVRTPSTTGFKWITPLSSYPHRHQSPCAGGAGSGCVASKSRRHAVPGGTGRPGGITPPVAASLHESRWAHSLGARHFLRARLVRQLLTQQRIPDI